MVTPPGGAETGVVHDAAYLERKEAINAVLRSQRSGRSIPRVAYLPEEDEVWRTVSSTLAERHARYACAEYLAGARRLALPEAAVPQLAAVDAALGMLTGFHIRPVDGLVEPRQFYGSLAERAFCSTGYVRHPASPFYTPEPDIVHELIGHVNMLAHPLLAELYAAAGRASRRATTPEALEFLSRVFWFTLEFGVVLEDRRPKAYGAGLLSSCGEIEVFSEAELRPFDIEAMGRLDYDITHYQPVLFLAPSFGEMATRLGAFFDAFDDARYFALASGRGAAA